MDMDLHSTKRRPYIFRVEGIFGRARYPLFRAVPIAYSGLLHTFSSTPLFSRVKCTGYQNHSADLSCAAEVMATYNLTGRKRRPESTCVIPRHRYRTAQF